MRVAHLSQFKQGWFIGAFKPSLLSTSLFEVAIKRHRRGERYPAHYQNCAKEYNVLLHGRMRIGKRLLVAEDIFVIQPGEVCKPIFLTDVEVVCIKVPSLPGDKVLCR